ncbi:MAG: hypothetical protein H6Q58_712 [Firmicutes bacterium]|nr:hypothetical protein [Bacillota bacterium]
MKKTIIAAAVFLAISACVSAAAHEGLVSAKHAQSQTAAVSEQEPAAVPVEAVEAAEATVLSRGESEAAAPMYGELLKWGEANGLIPRGTTFQVRDLYTGKTFSITRTYGTNHIDGEATTISDSEAIKSIWGGFTWERRPVIVTFNGQSIAASMSAMPHAGLDSKPADATVSNRSDGYGTGTNLDAVKDNGMDGVVDIHFLGSTRHLDGEADPRHQAAIQTAAGN